MYISHTELQYLFSLHIAVTSPQEVFLKEFIDCYHKSSALWNTKNVEYLSRSNREESLAELLKIWKKHKGSGSLVDVKKQLYSLRSIYRRELKRTIIAERNNKLYRPSSRIYKMLNFLRDHIAFDQTTPDEENDKAFLEGLTAISDADEEVYVSEKTRDSQVIKCLSPKKFLQEFIQCYQKHPVLWDLTHPEYHSRVRNLGGLKELLRVYRKFYGSDSDLDDVRKKIHIIRTVFRREQKKLNQDSSYTSKVWWLPLAMFLSETEKWSDLESDSNKTAMDRVTGERVNCIEPNTNESANSNTHCANPRAFVEEFIRCVSNNPVLWDKEHPLYRCRRTKKAAYQMLREIYRRYYNRNGSYEDIRKRIHSIRTAYRREWLKMELNPNYESRLWWFPMANFLRTTVRHSQSEENLCETNEVHEHEDTSVAVMEQRRQEELTEVTQCGEEHTEGQMSTVNAELEQECVQHEGEYKKTEACISEAKTSKPEGRDTEMSLFVLDHKTLVLQDPAMEMVENAPTPDHKCTQDYEIIAEHMIPYTDTQELPPGAIILNAIEEDTLTRLTTNERQKIKISDEDKLFLNYFENNENVPLRRRDSFDMMTKIWSDKLRNMHQLQRQYASEAINEIISQGEMKKLSYEFVQRISAFNEQQKD